MVFDINILLIIKILYIIVIRCNLRKASDIKQIKSCKFDANGNNHYSLSITMKICKKIRFSIFQLQLWQTILNHSYSWISKILVRKTLYLVITINYWETPVLKSVRKSLFAHFFFRVVHTLKKIIINVTTILLS